MPRGCCAYAPAHVLATSPTAAARHTLLGFCSFMRLVCCAADASFFVSLPDLLPSLLLPHTGSCLRSCLAQNTIAPPGAASTASPRSLTRLPPLPAADNTAALRTRRYGLRVCHTARRTLPLAFFTCWRTLLVRAPLLDRAWFSAAAAPLYISLGSIPLLEHARCCGFSACLLFLRAHRLCCGTARRVWITGFLLRRSACRITLLRTAHRIYAQFSSLTSAGVDLACLPAVRCSLPHLSDAATLALALRH